MSIVAKVDVRGFNALVHGSPGEPFVTASHHFDHHEMKVQAMRREHRDGREYFTLSMGHRTAETNLYLTREQAGEIVDALSGALADVGEDVPAKVSA